MSVSGITGRSGAQISAVLTLQRQLADLNRQLGTGQKSESYAGLGLDRGLSMALRNQLSTLQAYQQSTTVIDTRLSMTQNALKQIDASAHAVKSSAAGMAFTLDHSGQTLDQQTAAGQLDQILGALNTRFGDQYLFSGKSSDVEPVETMDHILNGDGTKAGLKQVIAERKQADLGTSGLGRLVPPPIVSSPASLVGAGAALAPDAAAVVTGGQNIGGAFTSAGGTLVINGTTINIPPGSNAAGVLAAINAPANVSATGVTASLSAGNRLVLTSANADTAIAVGSGSTLLGEFGLSAVTTQPSNLLTQGAVTAGQTMTISIGANTPLTITFGTNGAAVPPEVSTLAELNGRLATLAGGTASANSANGNITINATASPDSIIVGGTANAAAFGLTSTTGSPAGAVSIGEDAAGHPFGFKLNGVSSTLTGATVTTGGPPTQYTVNMASNPVAGQSVSFVLDLPDGTSQTVKLTATTANPPGDGQFTIAPASDVTAANFKTALTSAISKTAATALTAASAFKAADGFFNIDAANPPQRVSGPPFDTATTMTAGTPSDTVSWYRGEAGPGRARDTAFARVDTSISVSYGARANEQALRDAVSNIAVFAATSFSAADPNAAAQYTEFKQRVTANLDVPAGSQKIPDIEAELANAQTTMASGKDRQQQTESALNTMIDSITGIPPEQVGVQILALQTRLQASLQTTALLAKTSLVYFLP
jgi:flagellar hook-associated protein 3 FlgL